MKKIVSVILATLIICSVCVFPVYARWSNTSAVVISHSIYSGDAKCAIDIYGYSGATISNVDVRLYRILGTRLELVASWDDLASGQNFEFRETVPDVEPYYTYRLSFTAEVHRNGTVEDLDMYKDTYYVE